MGFAAPGDHLINRVPCLERVVVNAITITDGTNPVFLGLLGALGRQESCLASKVRASAPRAGKSSRNVALHGQQHCTISLIYDLPFRGFVVCLFVCLFSSSGKYCTGSLC